jgi:uncharacterized OB-fold protein
MSVAESGGTTVSPEEFWEFVGRGEIRFPRCANCGSLRWPAHAVCHQCLSRTATWELAPAEATILSFIVVHESIVPARQVPFVVAHAELDNGVRYTANVLAPATDAIFVGMRVRIAIENADGTALPQFVPI